ncbi:MAG: cyclomaltodextrinase N-terminal domain-containing protein, partial [Betaproteobacteria bacterium]
MNHPRQLSAAMLIAASSLGAAQAADASTAALAMPAQIERIEPAFWWVGMKSDKLQLMVHGPHIGDAAARIADAAGATVRIESVSRVANPNYLFID